MDEYYFEKHSENIRLGYKNRNRYQWRDTPRACFDQGHFWNWSIVQILKVTVIKPWSTSTHFIQKLKQHIWYYFTWKYLISLHKKSPANHWTDNDQKVSTKRQAKVTNISETAMWRINFRTVDLASSFFLCLMLIIVMELPSNENILSSPNTITLMSVSCVNLGAWRPGVSSNFTS